MMEFLMEPVFGIGITLFTYMFFVKLKTKWTWINPFVNTVITIILFLLITGIPYEYYAVGGDMFTFLLGPATIALGVPIYREAPKIKKNVKSILLGNLGGSIMGIVSAGFLVYIMGGSTELMYSMMPKSATTPISVSIVENLGGLPALGATLTSLTGITGSIVGPPILRMFKITDDISMGAALGTTSHGIGTARAVTESYLQGSISAFSMGMTGIITSLLFIPLYYLF